MSEDRRDPLQLALAALRRRERSRAELSAWLAARGFGEEEVAATVGRLEQIGELDDARFARLFAADKRELRGWGPERIRAALGARGLAEEDVEAATVEGPREQTERAALLLAGRGEPVDSDQARARALAFLTRRGFSYEVAYDAIRGLGREAA